MVLAGNISQLALPDSLKASRWSKRQWSVVARSHGHSKQMMNDGSKIQVRQRHVLYGIPTQRISTSSSIEVSYKLLRYYKDQRVHSRT
jgi:hypothetical protein